MISMGSVFENTKNANISSFLKPADPDIKEYNKVNNTIEIECNSFTIKEFLLPIIEYIRDIGNGGHSFEIIVDPESSENKKSFFFDGDGSHSIKNIKLNSIDLKKVIKGKY